MFEWNPTDIRKIIKTCGDLALRYYEAPRTEIKSDRSLVTEADHAIETHLESVFDHPESGSYLIGEETIAHRSAAYVEDAFQNEAWIVDPIDGTAPYANHLPTWGVSIGRMVDGSLTDGAICLPVTNEIFFTDGPTVRYGTLTGECRPIDPRAPRLGADDEKKTGMIALTQALAKGRGIAVPNPVQALGCTILPLTYLLLGSQRTILFSHHISTGTNTILLYNYDGMPSGR